MKPGLPNPPEATLTCVAAGESAKYMEGRSWVIRSGDSLGRRPEKATHILGYDCTISMKHCSFECRDGKWFIKDENSHNGTYLGKLRLPKGGESPIMSGWLIRIGEETIKFTY